MRTTEENAATRAGDAASNVTCGDEDSRRASRTRSPAVLCPRDRTVLRLGMSSAVCHNCGRSYAVTDGVLCLLEAPDAFYEGAYLSQVRYRPRSERWLHRWPLWLLNGGYVWRVRSWLRQGSAVVELGCGGGVAYFADRYHMTGIDLSFASLKAVAPLYDQTIQADATVCVPLPSRSVDAVISACFWEHLKHEEKLRVLAECRRVLRPGGKVVFLYDVQTGHPWIARLAASHPELYRTAFLEKDGHVGYATIEENRAIMQQEGFEVLAEYGIETTLLSASALEKIREWPGASGVVARIGSRLAHGPLFHVFNASLRAVDDTIGRIVPVRWSRMVIHVLQLQDIST